MHRLSKQLPARKRDCRKDDVASGWIYQCILTQGIGRAKNATAAGISVLLQLPAADAVGSVFITWCGAKSPR
jgi:hypothetical protein